MRISDWSSDVCSSDLLPGGHKGPLRERWRRRAPAEGEAAMTMERLDAAPWPDEGVPLEVAKGTLVVLHGKLPHGSGPNRSSVSRSEERRVGKECVRTRSSRWAPDH